MSRQFAARTQSQESIAPIMESWLYQTGDNQAQRVAPPLTRGSEVLEHQTEVIPETFD